MTAEDLEELKRSLDDGQVFDGAQCQALLAEVWRFKAMATSRSIEARVAREEADRAGTALRDAQTETEALRNEIARLNAIGGVVVCELEDRWSNCALRRRKCAEAGDHSEKDAAGPSKAVPH